MSRKLTILTAFLCSLFLLTCGTEEIATLDDIIDPAKRVHNTSAKWGDEPKVSLEFVQKIGEFEVTDENYMLWKPSDVVLDRDGNIYILDSGNYRIQKFTPEGEYLATIGSQGQGPGGFMMPSSMDIDDQGNLFVSDQKKSGVSVLAPDGKQIRTIGMGIVSTAIHLLPNGELITGGGTAGGFGIGMASYAGTGAPVSVSVYSSDGGGKGGAADLSGKAGSGPEGGSFAKIVIEQTGNVKKEIKKEAAEEAIEKILMIKLYDPEGKYKSSFCPPLDYNDMLMNAMGNGIYTALGPDSTVYVTFNYQNRIERYSADGELLFSADRPVNYEVTGPKKDKDDESTTEVKKSDVYVVYSLNMPGFNNVSRGIGVDSKGRAWVMTYAKQYDIENDDLPKLQIEVFDDKGVLLCVLPWEEDFIPATNALNIIGDLVFFFDTEGVSVYEYRITESK